VYSYLSPGEHRSEPTDSSHPNNGSVAPIQNPPDSQNTIDPSAEHGEQDADDEAAEDTDDTRSVTSSDMSRSSSGTGQFRAAKIRLQELHIVLRSAQFFFLCCECNQQLVSESIR